jgi:hypothetical protein
MWIPIRTHVYETEQFLIEHELVLNDIVRHSNDPESVLWTKTLLIRHEECLNE